MLNSNSPCNWEILISVGNKSMQYEIKIIQNYEIKNKNIQATNAKIVWANHPSRINQNNMRICTLCNSPTPEGEIKRWGKCSFCWRRINN